jgi:diacylglycerol kinase (ATP)
VSGLGSRVGLVVNPYAAAGTAPATAAQLATMVRRRGHRVVHLSDTTPGRALGRARAAVRQGDVDVLLVAGGDGTTHLGINACAGTDVPLLALGQGTGNDIVEQWGLPLMDPEGVVALLDDGSLRPVDAVHVTGEGTEDRPWYGGVLYGGFDSVVNERANRWSWPRGRARYTLAMLRELPVFRPISYSIEVDGRPFETEAMLVAVANTSSYGGGMRICPEAAYDDGLLDVLVLHEVNRAEFLRVFPRVFSGAHVGHPAVQLLRGRRVSLRAEGVVAYADGERFAAPPLTCEVVPGAVRLMGPSPASHRTGGEVAAVRG